MNKTYKAIASAMVMFAFVVTTLVAPIAPVVAEANFGFNTDLNIDKTLDFDFPEWTGFNAPEGAETISETTGTASRCFFDADRKNINFGESVTLNWDTAGFDEIKINGETITQDSGTKKISALYENTVFTLEALSHDGSKCLEQIIVECEPPETPIRCEDFGYDFEIGKFEWEGHSYVKENEKSGYSLSVTGNAQTAHWTANPAVDGVIAKAATVVEEFAGGTSGSISKTDIGTGKHDISHVAFCGYKHEEPKECKLEIHKSVDKHTANIGDILTYTIDIKNVGDADCTGGGVKIEDVLDANLTLDDYTYTSNLDAGYGSYPVFSGSDRTIRFNGHDLTPGESGSIELFAKVNAPHQCGDFKVKNQAKATAKELDNFHTWVYSTEVKTSVNYDCEPEVPSCPLVPAQDRTIVEFTNDRLYSDRGISNSQTDIYPVNIPAAKYDVTLVSWDGYSNRVNVSQPNEKYKAQFLQSGVVVATSNEISDLADNVISATNNELVNSDLELTVDVDGVRAVHAVYPDASSPNSHQPICLAVDKKPEDPKGEAKVVAHKIVCTDESELPNWGAGGPNITADTATNWVRDNASCEFAAGWEFEWTDDQSTDPGDTLVGQAGAPWNTFGPTDVTGRTETTINLETTTVNRLWFREVLQSGFIPFTHGPNGQTNVDDVSAEFYCDTDVINYDNRDFISGLQKDNTYYCVAFNAPVPDVPAPSCDSFIATPPTILVGASSTLSWESTNATQAFLNNGIGAVPVDGTYVVSPLADITYTLTLIGAEDKTVDCEVPVTVSEDPVPVCEYFTATPDELGVGGGEVTLAWSTDNAVSASIAPTIGSVGLVGTTSINVTDDTNFVLTVVDDNGDEVTCPAPVTVEEPEELPFSCENNVTFTASDYSIRKGNDITLNWSTTEVDSVTISPINATGLSGSRTVSPNDDTRYVLTATKDSETVTCPIDVEISTGGGGGGSASPRCELEISDDRITLGDEVTLEWDTSFATAVTLVDDRGNVLFTTDDYLASDKDEYYDGEITVKPTRDTEYTLIAERGSRDRKCSVDVEIENEVTVIEERDQQPLVAGISLSQVPYTGFEAGPFMTLMFYALLVAWALFLSYLLAVRNRPITESVVTEQERENVTAMKQAEAIRPDVFTPSTLVASTATASAPTAHTPVNLPTATPVQETVTAPAINPHQVGDALVTALEDRAHAQKALLSSDAVRHFISTTEGSVERNEALDEVIVEAKNNYPLEDGWIVINEARMKNLCETCQLNSEVRDDIPFVPSVVPEGSGSLAEAIVTGNITAAYEMIGSRPMFALADAAADLDALYRHRRGGDEIISLMLEKESTHLSEVQIQEMIKALTSALDGTYTDEASAVKMAIMKAVKAGA